MTGDHPKPWPGIWLAIIGGGAILATGANPWLALGIVVVWIGSLWLVRPEPSISEPPPDPALVIDAARQDLIEAIGVPLVLVARQRIVAANGPARAALGAHILGQDARIALRHPDAMRLLDTAHGDSVTIPGLSGGRTLWHLTRRQIDEHTWLIELIDRTAEADMSRAHTDFVANASHELRTPLSAIIGYVETLEDSGAAMDAATRDRFHQTVLREARRMQTLVSDLMSLSQVEAEKHDLPSEALDLARLSERVVGEAAAIAGKERLALTLPGGELTVKGDRTQLEQLVRNLVDNALKYGDATAPVAIRLIQRGAHQVELQVADRGAGIAPEHLPLLTRRFYRTDPGRSRAAGGTGLGLAIVKHIVERHRGRLDIVSELGHGTTVSVVLPLIDGAPGPLS